MAEAGDGNDDPNLNSIGFDLDQSNLDTIVNVREGTTAKDLLVLALALSVRHNWNYEELINYLQSQNSILEIPCLPQSKTTLFRILRQQASELTYHAYCPECWEYLGEKDNLPSRVKCKSKECKDLILKSKLKYFVSLDLKSQLQRFLAIPGIANQLNYHKNRKKRNVDSMQDIFDGSEYKRLLSEGVISEHDFTYIFNTDGVKYLKGAQGSAWPIYIRINELPPGLRQKYLFLAGIWVDSIEPRMNMFLQPFVDQANNLSVNGVSWKPDGVNTIVSKFVPLCQCVDSKARYVLYNMSQFNAGSGGCTFCNITGVQSGGTRFPVLPPHNDPAPLLRTDKIVKDQMVEAELSGTVIEGVKGVSALMHLQHFKMMGGQGLDDLHACYEGCAKHHTDLLMRVKGQTSLTLRQEVVNSRLRKIKFPSQLSRNVFDIKKKKTWKGSMWRTWLLSVACVCLQGLIPDKFIAHFALLSHAVFLISQDEIMQEDLPVIHRYIVKYVTLFETYFGVEHMYYNIHLMLHFHDCIMSLGPSWVYIPHLGLNLGTVNV
ncbi:hypothetical protein FOCC_FOCC008307 [Frankliniella occidentalis]|nr:hypothetical protein FOCC_FOCC008307 [Frankliniella occidentalis]